MECSFHVQAHPVAVGDRQSLEIWMETGGTVYEVLSSARAHSLGPRARVS